MRVASIDHDDLDLAPTAVDALRAQVRGPLLLAGDPGYDDARALWNGMIDRRPAMIARCLGTADVVAAVRFAREHDVLLCIKGGGHNIAGLAAADGALMLDLSAMRGVWVSPVGRVARAQAGCILGDVDRETQLHGLATPLGFVSATGIAGLTLGGGFGYLTRRWGWTADNVIAMDLVTADGTVVRATSTELPDLFWGLRGGGWNFGVVTGIEYQLHPVGPEIVGGIVAWRAEEAPRVLELYRSLAESAPPELTLVALLRPAPPAPWLPADVHGKPIVAIVACHTGRLEDGEKAVGPLKTFGTPVGDVLVRRPYTQMQTLLDATQPKGRRYYWKSEFLPAVDEALCGRLVDHAARIPSRYSSITLFQIGGALQRLPGEATAIGHRDARYVLNLGSSWERPDDDEINVAWTRDSWSDMREFSTGGTYVNFLTADESPERIAAAIGPGLDRLAALKAEWDPDNVFRTNRHVAPLR